MPSVPRKNVSTIYAEVPHELYRGLRDRARAARRTFTAELIVALEAHLGVQAEPKPRVGRPRNEG